MSKPEKWTNWDDGMIRLLAIVISPFIFGPFILNMLQEQGMSAGDAFFLTLPISLPIGYLPFLFFDLTRMARRAAAHRKRMVERRANDADVAAAISQEAAKWHNNDSAQKDKTANKFVDDLTQMRWKIIQERDIAAADEKRRHSAQQVHFHTIEAAFEVLRRDVVYHAVETLHAAENSGSLRVYSDAIEHGDSTPFRGPVCQGWELFDGLILTTEAPNLRYGRHIFPNMTHDWNRLPDNSLDDNEFLLVSDEIVTPHVDYTFRTRGLIYTLPGGRFPSDRVDEQEWCNSVIPELCWRMNVSLDPETDYYAIKPIRYHILRLAASLSNPL